MSLILSVAIKYEHDVVAARQRARQIAGLLGFDTRDQTRIATAVSEIIADLSRILSGRYTSATGMGGGIIGARRLMDNFVITSEPGKGTAVTLTKIVPRDVAVITAERMSDIVGSLARQRPRTPMEEVQLQNQELLRALEELRAAKRSCDDSTASSRTPTGVWWPSMPSWTRRPTTCAAPTT